MIKFFTNVRQSVASSIAIAAAAASVAAAGGALIASPAFADTVSTTTSVSYAGLDLSTPTGQARMQHRVRAAARQVCGYDAGERDLDQIAAQNACIAQALNGAQTELAALTSTTNSGQRVAVSDAANRNVPGSTR